MDLPQTDGHPANAAPLIYVIAGEHSGDNLGARLMAALRREAGENIRFAGVGGPAMTGEGLQSLFPISDIALMGLAEVLPHLPRLARRLRETAADIRRLAPDLVVTVDSPGFSLRVARRVRGLGVPVVHYVAPQLWAWRPGRGRKMSEQVDHILALLPFEPAFFSKFGVPCTYVGHPILESGADRGDGASFRARHGIGPETTLISVLPGSRPTEVGRLLPVFGKSLELLTQGGRNVTALVSTVDTVGDAVAAAAKSWPFPTVLLTNPEEKYDAFAASQAAITKSGTITLELALAGLPMVVCYKVSGLTAFLARRLIRVDNVALVNLLAEEPIVPELLQEACTPEAIADAVERLLDNEADREAQIRGFQKAVQGLGGHDPTPSERAASVVLRTIHGRGSVKDDAAPA